MGGELKTQSPLNARELTILAKPVNLAPTPEINNVGNGSWEPPVVGIVTSSFGERVNPVLGKDEIHTGVDIAVPIGTNAKAVLDGEVIYTGTSPTYGINLKYRTYNGYTFMYAHLSESLVGVGDSVKAGDIIAKTGNTGLSTGPHIHVTVYKGEEMVDPLIYFDPLKMTQEVKQEYISRGQQPPY